jgi:hypothetical protein
MRQTSLMNNDTIAIMTQNETMTEFGDNDVDDWLRLVNSPPEINDEHPVKETSAPSETVHKAQRTRHEERPDERTTPNIKSAYQDNEILIKAFGSLFERDFKWKPLHRLYRNYKGGGKPFEKFDTERGKNVSVKMKTTEEKTTIYPIFVSLGYLTEWDPNPVTIKVGGTVEEEVFCKKQETMKFVNKGTNEIDRPQSIPSRTCTSSSNADNQAKKVQFLPQPQMLDCGPVRSNADKDYCSPNQYPTVGESDNCGTVRDATLDGHENNSSGKEAFAEKGEEAIGESIDRDRIVPGHTLDEAGGRLDQPVIGPSCQPITPLNKPSDKEGVMNEEVENNGKMRRARKLLSADYYEEDIDGSQREKDITNAIPFNTTGTDAMFMDRDVPDGYLNAVRDGEEGTFWEESWIDEKNKLIKYKTLDFNAPVTMDEAKAAGTEILESEVQWKRKKATNPKTLETIITKRKARLCAKEFTGERGKKTFVPMVSESAFRIILAFGFQNGFFICTGDHESAFLHGEYPYDSLLRMPRGLRRFDEENRVLSKFRVHQGETIINASKSNFKRVSITGPLPLCNVCLIDKSRKVPLVTRAEKVMRREELPRNPTDIAERVGQITHIDLEFYDVGSLNTKNTVNFYLIDEFSNEHYCVGLTGKSGKMLSAALDEYTAHLGGLTGEREVKLFPIQCDSPPEFIDGDFALKLHTRACAPYVEEQNGKVEVAGGNISDQVTARLLDVELPYDLWEEARDHYLKCRRVMAIAASPTSPYPVMTGRSPEDKFLRIKRFGCVGFALIPKEIRELCPNPKGFLCLVLGPSDWHKAWRVLKLPERVHVVKHLICNEDCISSTDRRQLKLPAKRVDQMEETLEDMEKDYSWWVGLLAANNEEEAGRAILHAATVTQEFGEESIKSNFKSRNQHITRTKFTAVSSSDKVLGNEKYGKIDSTTDAANNAGLNTTNRDVTIKDVTDSTDKENKELDDCIKNPSVRNAVVNKQSNLIDTSLKKTQLRTDDLSTTVNSTMVKSCSGCKLDRNEPHFSRSQWKNKACDRRCLLCVENNVPSTKGSDKYGQLTDTTSTWVQGVQRDEALKRTRTTLQPKLADWIDRISMDLKEENGVSNVERAKRELRNLRLIQRDVCKGPPKGYNAKVCGKWYPYCHSHGTQLRSHTALMSHFGNEKLHKTLHEVCSDDWPNRDNDHDHWDGDSQDDDNEDWNEDHGSDDEGEIPMPVPKDTLLPL